MKVEIIPKYILEHFEDDKKSFARISEQMQISGEHMSHIRKDLTEVKDILLQTAEDLASLAKSFKEHKDRVEPVIKAYEDAKTAERLNHQLGDKVLRIGKYVSTASLIGFTIMYLIKKFS